MPIVSPQPRTTGLRIAVVGGVRFTTAEPHAGGLERHTDTLARELRLLGHDVTVFAGSSIELSETEPSDSGVRAYDVEALVDEPYRASPSARADVSMPPERFMIEHDAYLDVLGRLDRFDVVHNNSLHYLPVVTASRVPVVHTLHTPPTPWLESAYRVRDRRSACGSAFANSRVVSVSNANAAQWNHAVDRVVHNGVQLARWPFGSGGGGAVWTGRIVPEKGLHLAIDAAVQAGVGLRIAGPIHDRSYFESEIAGRLDRNRRCDYVGHLCMDELGRLISECDVAVLTPRWEEPFGLVAAEALACGTPVAAFRRGALDEIVTDEVGALARPDDVADLAEAMQVAMTKDRRAVRRRAEQQFAASVMASRYVRVYEEALTAALPVPA